MKAQLSEVTHEGRELVVGLADHNSWYNLFGPEFSLVIVPSPRPVMMGPERPVVVPPPGPVVRPKQLGLRSPCWN